MSVFFPIIKYGSTESVKQLLDNKTIDCWLCFKLAAASERKDIVNLILTYPSVDHNFIRCAIDFVKYYKIKGIVKLLK